MDNFPPPLPEIRKYRSIKIRMTTRRPSILYDMDVEIISFMRNCIRLHTIDISLLAMITKCCPEIYEDICHNVTLFIDTSNNIWR